MVSQQEIIDYFAGLDPSRYLKYVGLENLVTRKANGMLDTSAADRAINQDAAKWSPITSGGTALKQNQLTDSVILNTAAKRLAVIASNQQMADDPTGHVVEITSDVLRNARAAVQSLAVKNVGSVLTPSVQNSQAAIQAGSGTLFITGPKSVQNDPTKEYSGAGAQGISQAVKSDVAATSPFWDGLAGMWNAPADSSSTTDSSSADYSGIIKYALYGIALIAFLLLIGGSLLKRQSSTTKTKG